MDNTKASLTKFLKILLRCCNFGMQVSSINPQSPDLNPIENLWEIVNMKINRENCKNKANLFQALKIAWEGITLDTINNLISSMSRRCSHLHKGCFSFVQ